MLSRSKENISALAMASLLGLLLTSCTQSTAKEYGQRSSSERTPSAAPAASPDANVGAPNMDMPAKPAAKASKSIEAGVAPNQVVIENFAFAPATLTVKAGTKVTWINRDDVPHTATETDKRFNSKTLDTDDQFAFTFSEPGTYNYYCALHPKMTGQIIVK